MKDSGLISLLKTFSKIELNRFGKFLLSPYFTEGKNVRSRKVVEYFRVLKRYHPEFTGKNFTNENLFKAVYPNSKFKDYSIRKINTDLLKLAEKFLVLQELEISEIESGKFLMNQLKLRKQEKLFSKSFGSMIKYLNGLKKDEDYFYETYSVWQNYWSFYFGKKNIYKLEDAMGNINNYFIYVILGSLRIYLWAISYFRVINRNNDILMFDEIMKYVSQNPGLFSKIPQIQFYHYLIKLVISKDEEYFIKLKELKSRAFDSLTDPDKQNLFITMTNYCNDMISSGHSKFRKERFELDKEYLKLVKKLDNQQLHGFYILAATKNANRLGKYKWVEKILKEFESYTLDEGKEFIMNYVKSDMCFMKNESDKAIEHLSKIKTPYSNEKQNVRNLMIQIFYEKSETDSVLSLSDAGKHFLKRDKHLSESSKLRSLNFIKFTEKLIHLKTNPDKQALEFLKKELLETSNVLNKDWLLNKLNSVNSARN